MSNEIKNKANEKMSKAIDNLQSNLNALRAGRANPAMLDRIVVDYYGSPTPVNQMASISAPEPRTLTIQPWDQSALKLIEKAIMNSDLGLNPSNDGKIIRLSIPQLTEERRKELCKLAQKEGENAKVAVRNVRRNAIHDLKASQKNGEITEDALKDFEDEIQKITDKHIKEIPKEKEINYAITDITNLGIDYFYPKVCEQKVEISVLVRENIVKVFINACEDLMSFTECAKVLSTIKSVINNPSLMLV